MKKLGRILGRLLIGVLIIALVLGGVATYYFKSYLPDKVAQLSFPQIDGALHVTGLNGTVDVYRDNMGIPHIYATTSHDLFFAEGYIHAQDRFWQMDAWRHIGSGSPSEMFGNGQVSTDAFLRTLGWEETAQQEYALLSSDSKAILDAYTDGVNAYLKNHDGTALSLEYAVLKLLSPDYKIAPWTPVNSLTWGKAMAWDLRGNMDEEIERAVLLKTLTPQQIDQLFPSYPSDHPVIVNQIGNGTPASSATQDTAQFQIPDATLSALQHNASLLDTALGTASDGIGSNSWVVSGALTTTGKPILANDPHLEIQMPSIWYQVDLHCMPKSDQCPYEVAGFSFAGVPGVIIGHNDKIAWGFTNTGPDVMDLFIEKVNPNNPNQYMQNGQWVNFQTHTETINVVGGSPVTITVRSTDHGPIISDTYGPLANTNTDNAPDFVPFKERAGVQLPAQYAIALEWTALKPSTPFEAVWGFDKAQNWNDFRAAAQNFHVPAQNLIYADTDGNIGYQMPGDVPIRKSGDGRYPVPGWTGQYDWTGFIPFDQLPYTFNPAEGYIVTANNQVAPKSYPYFITADWNYGFRANRIVNLIKGAPGKIDIAYTQKMQGDDYDSNAETYIPLLQQLSDQFTGNDVTALNLLKNWDYQAKSDSSAAAIFEAFWSYLLSNTFDDDLPKKYWPDDSSQWNEVMRNLAKNPTDPFWDDKTSKNVVETRDDIIKKSWSQAVSELEGKYGSDMTKWNWGQMHTATFQNQTLGTTGIGLIDSLFDRGPFPTSGGNNIVNATAWANVGQDYTVTDLPSMRMIVDMSNLSNSLTVHTTGESGHAYNKHYDDMTAMWAAIQYYPMLWDQQTVIQQTEGHLQLTP
jgi:penicillin G amidase